MRTLAIVYVLLSFGVFVAPVLVDAHDAPPARIAGEVACERLAAGDRIDAARCSPSAG